MLCASSSMSFCGTRLPSTSTIASTARPRSAAASTRTFGESLFDLVRDRSNRRLVRASGRLEVGAWRTTSARANGKTGQRSRQSEDAPYGRRTHPTVVLAGADSRITIEGLVQGRQAVLTGLPGLPILPLLR